MLIRRRLHRDERGIAVVTAIAIVTIMLALGLALLAIAGTQAGQSGDRRLKDSAFNLAEGVLDSEGFLLSRVWPELASQSPAGTATACGSGPQTLTGSLAAPPDLTTTSRRIQNLVSQTFTSKDYGAGATWTISVCDDSNGSKSWDDNYLTNVAHDANGADAAGIRKLWVRAQATVKGRRRAVVALVQVNQVPAFPGGFAVLTGGLKNDIGVAVTQTSSAILNNIVSVTQPLVTNGKIGVRCALLSLLSGQMCLAGVLGGINATGLGSLLPSNGFVQYSSPTAVGDDVIDHFRRQAEAAGHYHATVAAGGSCLPGGSSPGAIVFVEQVGTGDQTCDLSTTGNPQAKLLVVASGRVNVIGSGTFTGVIYGLNRQRLTASDTAREIVSVRGPASVRGAIYVDGEGGQVGMYPQFNVNALCTSLLGSFTCSLLSGLGVTGLLNYLFTHVPVVDLVGAMAAQLNSSGWHAVQADSSVVGAVTTYGSSGTVAGTFRQVPAS